MYVLVIYTELINLLVSCAHIIILQLQLHTHITHIIHHINLPHNKLIQKNNKQGERKILSDVWGEVPPGEISEYSFCDGCNCNHRN